MGNKRHIIILISLMLLLSFMTACSGKSEPHTAGKSGILSATQDISPVTDKPHVTTPAKQTPEVIKTPTPVVSAGTAQTTENVSQSTPYVPSPVYQNPECDCYETVPFPELLPIDPSLENDYRPGSPPEVYQVPVLKDPDVGKIVTVSLTPLCRDALIHFAYYINETTGKERLVTIYTHDVLYSNHTAILSVYETDIGGGKVLCRLLAEGTSAFYAKLLTRTYITEDEGARCRIYDKETDSYGSFMTGEFAANSDDTFNNCFFGNICYIEKVRNPTYIYNKLPDGRWYTMLRMIPGSSNEISWLQGSWNSIYERFDERCGLLALVSVD